MIKRTILCLALFVVSLTGQARAQVPEGPPTILIQVRSLDAVMDNVKLLVTLSGRENIAKQVEVSTATVSRAMNGSEMCPAKQESQSSLQFQCCGIAQTYTRPNWVL